MKKVKYDECICWASECPYCEEWIELEVEPEEGEVIYCENCGKEHEVE